MIECEGLFSQLVKAHPVPLLEYFVIHLQEGGQTPAVMLCNELVKQPLDKELERNSLSHITKKDEIVALTDHRNIVFHDRRGCGQVIHQDFVDLQQILAVILVTFVG